MPGFIINNSGGVADPNPANHTDWLRNHRFSLLNFFGQLPPTANKEFLMLKDVTLPDKTISELAIKTPGTTYKFAKQVSYTDLKMTFYGSAALLTKCLQLGDKAHDLTSGIGDFDDYKGQVTFMINEDGEAVDPKTTIGGGNQTGIKYDYHGAWISNVNHGQLTYTSSDIKSITVTIKFDFFEVTHGGTGDGGTDIVRNNEGGSASILEAPYNNSTTG